MTNSEIAQVATQILSRLEKVPEAHRNAVLNFVNSVGYVYTNLPVNVSIGEPAQ